MKLSEIIERLQKEMEQSGDYEVSDIIVRTVEGGKVIDLFY